MFYPKLHLPSRTYFVQQWCLRFASEVAVDFDGLLVRFKSGSLARFADGSVMGQCGDTAVLATAVSRQKVSSSASFIPLTVDYRQKGAAAGRIPTNFLRRELGPTDQEILISRAIDRSVRPFFSKGYFYETQLVSNLLSVDAVNDPDVLSINCTSAALAVSDIPWGGPIGACRVGYIKNKFLVNPGRKDAQNSQLDLLITAAGADRIVMMELEAKEAPRDLLLEAIAFGLKHTQRIVDAINELQKKCGKPKRTAELVVPGKEIFDAALQLCDGPVQDVLRTTTHDKTSRDKALTAVRQGVVQNLRSAFATNVTSATDLCSMAVDDAVKQIFRLHVLRQNQRCDGRLADAVRPINCQVDLFKPLHGSALFQRGQSQVLCTVTFDSPESAFRSDPVSVITGAAKEKKFLLHYEFPPYAVNEVGTGGKWVGRRELGHGALAEKALRSIYPNSFPFTTRLTAEVLESNGSTSMASVCGGSLALMDAGVPIKAPVAGVAMGLVTKFSTDTNAVTEYKVLTDILGIEDYMGDMDFKIAGSRTGFTALQMDLKVPGISVALVKESLHAAWQAKEHILKIMEECIAEPRAELKDNGPVCENIQLTLDQRAKLFAYGGYNVKKLQAETGCQLSQTDDMMYRIFAPDRDALSEARELIDRVLTKETVPALEFGAIYRTKIVELLDHGVNVQVHADRPVIFIPNAHLDQRKVDHPSALGLRVGQEIVVKYFGQDPVTGKQRLTRRALQTSSPGKIRTLERKSGIQPATTSVGQS